MVGTQTLFHQTFDLRSGCATLRIICQEIKTKDYSVFLCGGLLYHVWNQVSWLMKVQAFSVSYGNNKNELGSNT